MAIHNVRGGPGRDDINLVGTPGVVDIFNVRGGRGGDNINIQAGKEDIVNVRGGRGNDVINVTPDPVDSYQPQGQEPAAGSESTSERGGTCGRGEMAKTGGAPEMPAAGAMQQLDPKMLQQLASLLQKDPQRLLQALQQIPGVDPARAQQLVAQLAQAVGVPNPLQASGTGTNPVQAAGAV